MESSAVQPRRRLLLADDSVTIRKVVELTFAEEGIEVISAGDGDMAMQKFVEHTPDIVLVDVEMPGSSGYQICEMIKADESTQHIPVLLLVGSFEPFDQDAAERARANGFLTKPFHSIRELVSKVKELLDMEDEAADAVPAQTEDIDELYESSFAETVPLFEETTEEDLTIASFEGEADDQDGEIGQELVAEEESDHELGDASFDDEMVETLRPGSDPSANGHHELANAETLKDLDVPVEGGAGLDPDQSAEEESDGSQLDVIDESLDDTLSSDSSIHDSLEETLSSDSSIHDSKADTVEFASPFSELAQMPVSVTSQPDAEPEPTEEIIERIAKRVMERLSDRAVREVAQEAVPRIAEKLIREALEEESKT